MSTDRHPIEDASRLRAIFDAPRALTVGLEEEVMLLDPDSLELAPLAEDVLGALPDDGRFKLELPASQIEIITPPCPGVTDAIEVLAAGRAQLVEAAAERVLPACAGVHPFSASEGELNADTRGRVELVAEYGAAARRQLVCALQVHVAIGEAEATIAVHDALRSYLPELAALAANAPFYEGADTGLASVRPKIAEALPRQGIPPAFGSLDRLAEVLRFGRATGSFPSPGKWWWELRPNVRFGTLELRVPDAQTTIEDAAAVAAVAHCLIAWLLERHRSGEKLPTHDRWQIEENRWRACRRALEGELIDLETGATRPARERLEDLLEALGPVAGSLGCAAELELAHELIRTGGGAGRQRLAAGEGGGGARAVTHWLAERFDTPSRLSG